MSSSRIISTFSLIVITLCMWAGSVAAQSEEEKNTAAVKRFYDEVMGKGNLKVIDELVADNFVDHYVPDPKMPGNKAGLTQTMTMFRTAFPDLQVTVEDVIAKGDKVWVYTTMRGTQKGEFMDMPASGKKIEVKGFDIVRFVNGKAVEHWGLNDDYTMLQQLGVIPMPGQEEMKK
ncbi:ester cyclase [candidate division KSB1 bacterium]|nr:ester cyclase [candidate division KSB1 bacterium]